MPRGDPVPPAGSSPACAPAHLPGRCTASMSPQGVWQEGGQPHHQTPPFGLRAAGTHPSPPCSSSLAPPVGPAYHQCQPWGVCTCRRGLPPAPSSCRSHILWTPAALDPLELKVAPRGPRPRHRTHGWTLHAAKLSRLSVGRDGTRPHEGVNVPRGRQAGWGGCPATVASPHHRQGGFAAGLAGSRTAEPRMLAHLHARTLTTLHV